MKILKFVAVYSVFGVAFTMIDIFYCRYRAHAGNPSDLPCVSWLWTPIAFLSWPSTAMSCAINGEAVLLSPFAVRAFGIAFLSLFVLASIWVLRRRPDPTNN